MTRVTLKSAAKGFMISYSVCLLISVIIYLSAASVAAEISEVSYRPEYAAMIRQNALGQAVFIVGWIAAYWGISAVGGKGDVFAVRSANYTLLACGFCYALLMLGATFLHMNTLCDVRPMSHTSFSISRISECPSSDIAISALSNFMLVLLIVSIACRVIVSRRREKLTK